MNTQTRFGSWISPLLVGFQPLHSLGSEVNSNKHPLVPILTSVVSKVVRKLGDSYGPGGRTWGNHSNEPGDFCPWTLPSTLVHWGGPDCGVGFVPLCIWHSGFLICLKLHPEFPSVSQRFTASFINILSVWSAMWLSSLSEHHQEANLSLSTGPRHYLDSSWGSQTCVNQGDLSIWP